MINIKKPSFTCAIRDVFDAYADKCLAEHASVTLSHDFLYLKSLDEYLQDIGYNGGEISIDMLSDWVKQISENRVASTVALYEKTIRTFLQFASSFGIPSHMVDIITVHDDYQPYIFTQVELDGLCAAADNITYKPESSYPYIHAEIPMLTRIFISCGTRTEETLVLRMRDTDLENGVFTMHTTKGDIERYVPFSDELRNMLELYCRALGILGQPNMYLFPGKTRDEPFSQYMYHYSFIKMIAEIGIDVQRERKFQRAVCPYCMRHTFACYALLHLQKQGIIVDNLFPYLSVYMGHKDLYSTEKYLKLSEPLITEALSDYDKKMGNIYTGRSFNRDEVWI